MGGGSVEVVGGVGVLSSYSCSRLLQLVPRVLTGGASELVPAPLARQHGLAKCRLLGGGGKSDSRPTPASRVINSQLLISLLHHESISILFGRR